VVEGRPHPDVEHLNRRQQRQVLDEHGLLPHAIVHVEAECVFEHGRQSLPAFEPADRHRGLRGVGRLAHERAERGDRRAARRPILARGRRTG
jgi:hypothetical protein